MVDPRNKPAYDFRTLLTHRILVLSNTFGKGAMRLYAQQYGIQLAEWRLLAALMTESAPDSVNDLATALGTDKGWISRTAAALVKKGLAATVPERSDGRRFRIVVTPAGRRIYDRILPAAIERQRRLVSVLTEDELASLNVMIDKLQRQADALIADTRTDEATRGPAPAGKRRASAKAAGRR
ncbi:MAG: MarR family winged helix-turn-helix transcriptional regulator [Pigmentiphaga sp.]|uniref:MarR family winged helix-turn-helix transcriptional regulator n=1 Tax=Pigmentiphaga sp. TaxID=1977564 RepID=UPI0029A44E25|nr:MarR family winged helix-turn-helix transcriptional regulator [Pigmentiphaga sp.]MDX3905448.1 MarR family winged helix-turn-helix transcriptional regulator [Pigmentiphaga sp.]